MAASFFTSGTHTHTHPEVSGLLDYVGNTGLCGEIHSNLEQIAHPITCGSTPIQYRFQGTDRYRFLELSDAHQNSVRPDNGAGGRSAYRLRQSLLEGWSRHNDRACEGRNGTSKLVSDWKLWTTYPTSFHPYEMCSFSHEERIHMLHMLYHSKAKPQAPKVLTPTHTLSLTSPPS